MNARVEPSRTWVIINVCALVAGVGLSIVLSSVLPLRPGPSTPSNVAKLSYYLFHPMPRALVVSVFAIMIVRSRGVGIFSAVGSFLVGGMSTDILLSIIRSK